MMTSRQTAGRQCILEQARRLFLAHGYHGVSIRDIVQACGLSNAALYYHFGSKQSLFVAVIEAYVATVAQRVQKAGEGGGSCRERLTRMAEAHVQFILESRGEARILIRDLTQQEGEEIRHLLSEVMGQGPSLIASVLQEGIDSGEIRPLDARRISVLLLGMINSLSARRILASAEAPLTEEVELAINTLFEGIGA
jgi:AcrR family transcriptional regulator